MHQNKHNAYEQPTDYSAEQNVKQALPQNIAVSIDVKRR